MEADWRTLRSHADSQSGLLARHQCLAAGLTVSFIRHRLRSGRWTRPHEGVYLTRPGRSDWLVTAVAAFLAVQSERSFADAAFRGASALHLWGLARPSPGPIELVVPARRRLTAPAGVELRRTRAFSDAVHETVYPWRLTLEATVLDASRDLDGDGAIALVAAVAQRDPSKRMSLHRELTVTRRHRHRRLLLDVLADVVDGSHSPAEVRFLRDVLRAHGLPEGDRQWTTNAGRPAVHDLRLGAWGLIVEVDGRVGHETWSDRVRDGRRDRAVLAQEGELTTRLFWSDVAITPCRTAAELAAILRVRGWAGTVHPCRRNDCVLPRHP